MSYNDPHDPNRVKDMPPASFDSPGKYPMWGWIVGAVFLVLILAVIFNMANTGTMTSEDTIARPPVTTGQSNRPITAPPAGTATRPAPPATTGQGTGQGTPSGNTR